VALPKMGFTGDPGQPVSCEGRAEHPILRSYDVPRFSYLAAPALLLGYGVARLIDGLDGHYGPGWAWTIGHLFFGISLTLFGVMLVGLRRAVSRYRVLAAAALAAGLVGLLVFIRSVIVDLIVGFQAASRADMDRIYPRYDGFPGGLPTALTRVLDNVGPALFIVGLLTLIILLAIVRPRRLPWRSPALIAIGFACITVRLELLPLAGAVILIGLLPMRAQRADSTLSGASGEVCDVESPQLVGGSDGHQESPAAGE
jgi:hypothetical protein